MKYEEKVILANLLGDEWGGGELYDAYQALENTKKFFRIFIYIFSAILFIIGAVLMVIYVKDRKKHELLIVGLSLIVGAIIAPVIYHFV